MQKYKWHIVVLNLFLLLGYMTYSIVRKESLLKTGQLVLLELAPVDPRSLMQGDYMDLRYAISNDLEFDNMPKRGYCIVDLDSAGVATAVRFQEETTPLHDGEYPIRYSSPNRWNVNIGAESFFFQEGEGEKYEQAKYGGVKVDTRGNSLLVGLYDENRVLIE